MDKKVTMGSLFDGIAGFPLAAEMCEIEPIWASEVEPFPIAVSNQHFPNIKHLGDIKNLKGKDIPSVDIVTGGSPCQNLSIAGKREGLSGERSNLFLEQIRVIKEMRQHEIESGKTGQNIRPRILVWENVPGAFSSAKGEDFRRVLEEICKIADETVAIPKPAKNKWLPAGCVMGENFSVAWRQLDAQYWGVPQRRKRIFLVADFGGQSAAKILFEPRSVQGDFETSESQRTTTSERSGKSTQASIKKTVYVKSELYENHMSDARYNGPLDVSPTVKTRYGTGGNNQPLVREKVENIIRKLTPLECERLQGFPDNWTLLSEKENLSDEDFAFWKNIYIQRKNIKNEPTKQQILKWYNRLCSAAWSRRPCRIQNLT